MELLKLLLLTLLWTPTGGQDPPTGGQDPPTGGQDPPTAPVTSIKLSARGDVLVCSSEKILVKPTLSWSPPSEAQTEVVQAEDGLYSISSSITMDLASPQTFTCNISTHSSWKSLSYIWTPPVWAVNLTLRGDVLVCSSEKIYPQPNLTWSPPSEAQPEVVKEDGLYSIRSSITVDLKSPQQFKCTISTPSSSKSATYSLQPNGSGSSAAAVVEPVVLVVAAVITAFVL